MYGSLRETKTKELLMDWLLYQMPSSYLYNHHALCPPPKKGKKKEK